MKLAGVRERERERETITIYRNLCNNPLMNEIEKESFSHFGIYCKNACNCLTEYATIGRWTPLDRERVKIVFCVLTSFFHTQTHNAR
jgi:hypothetical protein